MPPVTVMGMRYKTGLDNIKLRCGRQTSVNLKEQANELKELKEVGLPTEDEFYREQILENQSREIFNPEQKTFNLGGIKTTDLRDNPRLHIPCPRPPSEELDNM